MMKVGVPKSIGAVVGHTAHDGLGVLSDRFDQRLKGIELEAP